MSTKYENGKGDGENERVGVSIQKKEIEEKSDGKMKYVTKLKMRDCNSR